MSSAFAESTCVGSACALVGMAAAGIVTAVQPDANGIRLQVAAGVAAFISATASWAIFVAASPHASRRRVALAMTGSAVIGHLLTWAIFSVATSPESYLAKPTNILKLPSVALVFGLVSLVMIGWLTIPLGIGVGLVARSRRVRRTAVQAGSADLAPADSMRSYQPNNPAHVDE